MWKGAKKIKRSHADLINEDFPTCFKFFLPGSRIPALVVNNLFCSVFVGKQRVTRQLLTPLFVCFFLSLISRGGSKSWRGRTVPNKSS